MALSLHERVAAAMKLSYSAGTFNSYDVILAKLREKFPTEEALQAQVGVIEKRLKDAGIMPRDMKFPDDAIEAYIVDDHKPA